ncbi:MAG: hypothetical protein P8X67_20665 [Syntrophobacterales bacterium]
MKYFLVICYIFVTLASPLSFAELPNKSKPAIYEVMETISLPYIPQCMRDPETVQEYLLTMEIEYLTWLKKEQMPSAKKDSPEWIKLVNKNLIEKTAQLKQLQLSCLERLSKHSR